MTSPNLYVVVGGASNAVQDFLNTRANSDRIVRVIRTPADGELPSNWTDVLNIDDLPLVVEDRIQDMSAKPKIGMVLAAAKTQEKLFVQETAESIANQLQSNLLVHVESVRALLPIMITHRFGRIVALSSFRSRLQGRGTTLYGASKSFLETFMQGIAIEYGRFDIAACSIRMGFFEGGLLDGLSDEALRDAKKVTALRRLGTRSDLTSALDFAMHNAFVSGGTINFEGALDFG